MDRSGKYVIRIGPLDTDQFQNLLNNKNQVKFIKAVSNIFLAQPLQCDIVLELAEGSTQPIRLGESEFSNLGQSTWLVSQDNQQTFSVVLNKNN